jgi:hypothetical protein
MDELIYLVGRQSMHVGRLKSDTQKQKSKKKKKRRRKKMKAKKKKRIL